MSTLERLVSSAANLAETVFWILAGALLDWCRQVYGVVTSRWGWLYAVLLALVVVALTVLPHS